MDKNIRLFCTNFHPVNSLKKVRQETNDENERQFFAEMKKAKFLVPCVGKNSEPPDQTYPAVLKTQEGENFLPAFSELTEFEKWPFDKIDVSIHVLSWEDLKYIMLEDRHKQKLAGIAINPFGQMLLLRQQQIAQIDAATQEMSVQRINHDQGLRLSRPKNLPMEVKTALEDLFRQRQEVYRAYLLSAQRSGKLAQHWLLLIDFDGAEAGLFPQVAKVVQPHMKQGSTFELIKATPRLLQTAVIEGKLIYQC